MYLQKLNVINLMETRIRLSIAIQNDIPLKYSKFPHYLLFSIMKGNTFHKPLKQAPCKHKEEDEKTERCILQLLNRCHKPKRIQFHILIIFGWQTEGSTRLSYFSIYDWTFPNQCKSSILSLFVIYWCRNFERSLFIPLSFRNS